MSAPNEVTAPSRSKLVEQVIATDLARQGAALIQQRLDAAREDFERENARLIELAANAKGTVAAEEERLRQLAIQEYEESGSKSPAPGVGIKVMRDVAYDAGRALLWAREFGLALKLDAAAFERTVLSQPYLANTPLEFVKVTERPQATLAKDLGKAVSDAR